MRTLCLSIVLLFASLAPAFAQQAARPLVRQWIQEQRATNASFSQLQLTEKTRLLVEGPAGPQETLLEARIEGIPGTMDFERTIEQMRFNRRPIPLARREAEERRRYNVMGVAFKAFMQSAGLPARLLARMTPTTPLQRDIIDGKTYWRFEMTPRREIPAIERLTVWFDQDDESLHQIRMVLNRRNGEQPLVVHTQYDRFEGLDLPVERITEGTVRRRQRGKLFTYIFKLQMTFGNHSLTP